MALWPLDTSMHQCDISIAVVSHSKVLLRLYRDVKTSHRWESVDLRLICLPSVLQVFMLWWFLSCCLVMIMFMSIQQHVVADTLFTDQLCSSVMCRKGASILMHTVSVKCHPNIPTCRLKTTHNVSSNQNPVLKLDIIQIPGSKIRHKERQTQAVYTVNIFTSQVLVKGRLCASPDTTSSSHHTSLPTSPGPCAGRHRIADV